MKTHDQITITIKDNGPTKDDPFAQFSWVATAVQGEREVVIYNLSSRESALYHLSNELKRMEGGA